MDKCIMMFIDLKTRKLHKHNYTDIRLFVIRKFITLFEVGIMTFVILFYDLKT